MLFEIHFQVEVISYLSDMQSTTLVGPQHVYTERNNLGNQFESMVKFGVLHDIVQIK